MNGFSPRLFVDTNLFVVTNENDTVYMQILLTPPNMYFAPKADMKNELKI